MPIGRQGVGYLAKIIILVSIYVLNPLYPSHGGDYVP